jgi:hypothetical protein
MIVHIAGFASCSYHQRALRLSRASFGADSVDDRTFATRSLYKQWLLSEDGRAKFGKKAGQHTSSPFVWVDDNTFVGGHDALVVFVRSHKEQSTTDSVLGTINEFMHKNQHDTTLKDQVQNSMRKYMSPPNLLTVGQVAPTFKMSTLDGTNSNLDLLKDFANDGKPLVLNFGSCS